jgi:hypothetical protein
MAVRQKPWKTCPAAQSTLQVSVYGKGPQSGLVDRAYFNSAPDAERCRADRARFYSTCRVVTEPSHVLTSKIKLVKPRPCPPKLVAPKITAQRGTPEWEKQVAAHENWLDQCYADANIGPRADDEISFNDQHRELRGRHGMPRQPHNILMQEKP